MMTFDFVMMTGAVTSGTELYWLSFADAALPTGQQFLGVCIVRAGEFIEAVHVSHALGINPGGECQGHSLVYQDGVVNKIPAEAVERLLSREECDLLMDYVRGDISEQPFGPAPSIDEGRRSAERIAIDMIWHGLMKAFHGRGA